jgi:HlyD family secretion protein
MIRKYLIPALAILGFISAVRTVVIGATKPPLALPLVEPSRPPYKASIAGAGIIEASSENIAIASPVSALITKVAVSVGQQVQQGELLFELDSRVASAQVLAAQADVVVAEARLAEAQLALEIYTNLKDPRAVSRDDLIKRESAVRIMKASLLQAQSALELANATFEQLQILAPISGRILKVDARSGEFASAQSLQEPLIVMGDVSSLNIRVDVDENDAWRVRPKTAAMANLRGNPEIKFDLEFLRFEPYVVPKRSLTGDSTERVDTRVLQIIYKIKQAPDNIFVGQLVDVYIDVPEDSSAKSSEVDVEALGPSNKSSKKKAAS